MQSVEEELRQRFEATATAFLRKAHSLSESMSGAPALKLNSTGSSGSSDRSAPSDVRCWLMSVDRVRQLLSMEYVDGHANPLFVHPFASSIMVDALVLGERYSTIARMHCMSNAAMRIVLDGACQTFVVELTSRGIELDHRAETRAA